MCPDEEVVNHLEALEENVPNRKYWKKMGRLFYSSLKGFKNVRRIEFFESLAHRVSGFSIPKELILDDITAYAGTADIPGYIPMVYPPNLEGFIRNKAGDPWADGISLLFSSDGYVPP